jgi:Zn-dependent protease
MAARLLGDYTAQRLGRLTLNPLRHLDPFGTLLLVLTMFVGAPGIGWGKPVPVDPKALRMGRRGMAIVSAAGPGSNLVLAAITAVLLRFLGASDVVVPDLAANFLVAVVILNIGLAVFNLLPVPPLDGFGVALGLLPRGPANQLARISQYGMGILLLLVFSGSLIRIDLLGLLLGPPRRLLIRLILGNLAGM